MALEDKTVEKVAKLARIAITDEEKQRYKVELSKVIDWFEVLNKVDTDDVDIMTSPTAETLPKREDKVKDGDIKEQILKNAPNTEFDCFLVPKVIDQG